MLTGRPLRTQPDQRMQLSYRVHFSKWADRVRQQVDRNDMHTIRPPPLPPSENEDPRRVLRYVEVHHFFSRSSSI